MKSIVFGLEQESFVPADLFQQAKSKKSALAQTKINDIIQVLHDFGQHWANTPTLTEAALAGMRSQLAFSEEMVRATLGIIPELLSREALTKRVQAEFGSLDVLDNFTPAKHGLGLVQAFPVGEILHVTAGNVFVSCIDSLLMGFLTKNVSYVKLSSRNLFFPFFFAKALKDFDKQNIVANKFCMLSWKGGNVAIETAFKTHVPAILAWGGEEMLTSYQQGLAAGTKLLDYGPKISFQLLTKAGLNKLGLETTAAAIAKDLIMWDQQACSSPQNLFIEQGIPTEELMLAIGNELDQAPFARGELSSDERVEILKERERARVSRHLENGHSFEGKEWLLHHETRSFLRVSPLNRTLILKDFKDQSDLLRQVTPFRFYLQTCGYLTGSSEKAAWLSALGSAGIKRLAPLGQMAESFAGLPHDGRYGLTELVNLVTDETAVDEDNFLTRIKTNVPYFKTQTAKSLSEMPLTNGSLFSEHDPAHDDTLIDKTIIGGRYFASGGSTGKPKHVLYSNHDLDRMCELLAENFRRSGVKPGTKVANLFAAGTLYSSFLAVDKYCEKMQLAQLPIGGLADPTEIVKLLAHHQPEAVFGLPGLLSQIADRARELDVKLTIPMVFFAGENLSEGQKALLRKEWNASTFWSAGYASVDAGVIGWQCAHAEHGVHHVAAPQVRLEIIEDEGVVTSFVRTAMPVIRYQTGDRMSWVNGNCACGDRAPRFKLLGRMDGLINLWASRIPVADITTALGHSDFQVVLDSVGAREVMEIRTTQATEGFVEALYTICKDLRHTTSLEQVTRDMRFSRDAAEKNPRTGKIPQIIDRR